MTRGTNAILNIRDGIARVDISTPKHPNVYTRICAEDLPRMIDGGPRWRASLYRDVLYVQRTIRVNGVKKSELLHRVLCRDLAADELADHKNLDTLDNCHPNLRPATQSQNRRNGRLRGGTSAFRGVSWHKKQNQWRAFDGNRHLGFFDDEIAAARVRDDAVRHHPFANLNFPEARAA